MVNFRWWSVPGCGFRIAFPFPSPLGDSRRYISISHTVTGRFLGRHSRQRERLSASVLSICSSVGLSVCRQNAKIRDFLKKLSNLELWCLLTSYRKLCNWAFQGTYYWCLKSKMAEIRHHENRYDVILFCRGWSDLDKISETGAEWHVDCGDVVEIETKCIIPIWRTFGRIQWHVLPEPCITLQGAATWWIHCHDSRATCHIAGCSHLAKSMSWSCHIAGYKHSIRHIENPFFATFYFFVNAV